MWLWNWVRSRLLLHVPASEHSPLFSSDCNLLEAFLEEAHSNEVCYEGLDLRLLVQSAIRRLGRLTWYLGRKDGTVNHTPNKTKNASAPSRNISTANYYRAISYTSFLYLSS